MRRFKFRSVFVWLACLVLSISAGFLYHANNRPLLKDSKHQFFIAERAASGVPPHISQFSAKTSLSFLLNGMAIYTGRFLGIDDISAVRGASILTLSLILFLVWQITLALTGSEVAAAFSGLSVLSLRGYMRMVSDGVDPKLFLLLFLFLSMFSFIRRRPAQTGISAACCFLCWQPSLLMAFICLVFFISESEAKLRKAISFMIAFSIPLVLYELYFWAHGAIRDQIIQSLVFPSRFMTHKFGDAGTLFKETLMLSFSASRLWNPLWLFALVGLIGTFFETRRKDRNLRFLCLFFFAALAFTIYEHQGQPDLLLFLCCVFVFSGVGCAFLWKQRSKFLFVGPAICILAAMLLIRLTVRGAYDRKFDYTVQDQEALAKDLLVLQHKCGEIYAIRTAHLLSFNHENNWSRYSSFFRGVPEYLRSLNGHGPEIPWESRIVAPVVIEIRSEQLPSEIQTLLDQKYQEYYDTHFYLQNIRVWVRKGECSKRTER